MSFAATASVRFTAGRGEGTWVPGTGTFAGLDDADRMVLADWLDRAGVRGIDLAMDFSSRPWNVSGVRAIVGVFEAGHAQASWLLVRSSSGWMLARCSDGFVSNETNLLPAILALIDTQADC
jgi:hypothetical protein